MQKKETDVSRDVCFSVGASNVVVKVLLVYFAFTIFAELGFSNEGIR